MHIGVTRCDFEPKKFICYRLVRVLPLANVTKTPYDLNIISCRFVRKFSWLYVQKMNFREWRHLKNLKIAIYNDRP